MSVLRKCRGLRNAGFLNFIPGGRITPGAMAWPPPSSRRGKWSSRGILSGAVRVGRREEEALQAAPCGRWGFGVPETAVRARRRREEAVLPVPRCVARPGARNGPQRAAPSAHSLLALGSASFWGCVRTDGCVGRLRSRPEGLDAILSKKEFRAKSRPPGVKSFRGRRAGAKQCIAVTLRTRDASFVAAARESARPPCRAWLLFPRPPRARRRAWPAAPRRGPSRATPILVGI